MFKHLGDSCRCKARFGLHPLPCKRAREFRGWFVCSVYLARFCFVEQAFVRLDESGYDFNLGVEMLEVEGFWHGQLLDIPSSCLNTASKWQANVSRLDLSNSQKTKRHCSNESKKMKSWDRTSKQNGIHMPLPRCCCRYYYRCCCHCCYCCYSLELAPKQRLWRWHWCAGCPGWKSGNYLDHGWSDKALEWFGECTWHNHWQNLWSGYTSLQKFHCLGKPTNGLVTTLVRFELAKIWSHKIRRFWGAI